MKNIPEIDRHVNGDFRKVLGGLLDKTPTGPQYTRAPQLIPTQMPTSKTLDFEFNLQDPGVVLDVFLDEEKSSKIHLRQQKVVRPVIIVDMDQTADLWRHAFCWAPIGMPISGQFRMTPVGRPVYGQVGDNSFVLVLYEKLIPPEMRVPDVDKLALLRYVQAADADASPWEKLTQEERDFRLQVVKDDLPRLQELAQARWGRQE